MMQGDKKGHRPRKEPPMKKADPALTFDYKEVALISKYISERGRMLSRVRAGLNAKQQRMLTIAVKRARMLAMLPFAN